MIGSRLAPDEFPKAKDKPFWVTSPSSGEYNCIAWALEIQHGFFWPAASDKFYWPTHLPRKNTKSVFLKFFQQFGFEVCPDGNMEQGFQKIVLFAKKGRPTHAARQLPNGFWTSKLGGWVDVQHTLESMEGGLYGDVLLLLKRQV